MKSGWALAAALVLASCSSGQGVNPLAKAIYGSVTETIGIGGDDQAGPAKPGKRLTRARIEETGMAMIRAKVGDEAGAQTLTGYTDNGGYITFTSAARQSVIMRGTLVTATRAIETDLLATRSYGLDPIATPTALANWPQTVRRVYHLPRGTTPEGKLVDAICTFEFGEKGEIEIIEVTYPVIQVLETCTSEQGDFENAHLVDIRDGSIWRTRQWIGFESAPIFIDVLEPYTE